MIPLPISIAQAITTPVDVQFEGIWVRPVGGCWVEVGGSYGKGWRPAEVDAAAVTVSVAVACAAVGRGEVQRPC